MNSIRCSLKNVQSAAHELWIQVRIDSTVDFENWWICFGFDSIEMVRCFWFNFLWWENGRKWGGMIKFNPFTSDRVAILFNLRNSGILIVLNPTISEVFFCLWGINMEPNWPNFKPFILEFSFNSIGRSNWINILNLSFFDLFMKEWT